jgi:hypothetical protein
MHSFRPRHPSAEVNGFFETVPWGTIFECGTSDAKIAIAHEICLNQDLFVGWPISIETSGGISMLVRGLVDMLSVRTPSNHMRHFIHH